MAARGREALAGNRLDEAAFVAEMMLKRQGIAIRDLAPAEAAKAKQAMLRAGIDLSEALKARYEGDFNYEPRDKLLKATLVDPHPKHWPTPAADPTTATAPSPHRHHHSLKRALPLQRPKSASRTMEKPFAISRSRRSAGTIRPRLRLAPPIGSSRTYAATSPSAPTRARMPTLP